MDCWLKYQFGDFSVSFVTVFDGNISMSPCESLLLHLTPSLLFFRISYHSFYRYRSHLQIILTDETVSLWCIHIFYCVVICIPAYLPGCVLLSILLASFSLFLYLIPFSLPSPAFICWDPLFGLPSCQHLTVWVEWVLRNPDKLATEAEAFVPHNRSLLLAWPGCFSRYATVTIARAWVGCHQMYILLKLWRIYPAKMPNKKSSS